MENMRFPTLNAYIAWRGEKRVEYHLLSTRIRLAKQEIRSLGTAPELQCSLIGLKADATTIMDERREAKVIARDSWDAWQEARLASLAA